MEFFYWIMATVTVVIGLFLLSIKYEGHLNLGSYRSIRLFLALGTFLDTLIYSASGFCVNQGLDPNLLSTHFIPLVFNFQISIMAYAMMGLLHLRHINKYTPLAYYISGAVATATIFIGYCVWSGGEFSWDIYSDFIANCRFMQWFRTIYVIYIMLALVRTCVHLIRASRTYISIVENYFSEEEELISARHLSGSVYIFVAYFLLSLAAILVPDVFANHFIEFGIAVCLMLFAIMIINCHNTYFKVYPPHNLAEMLKSLEERQRGVVAEEEKPQIAESRVDTARTIVRGSIEDIITEWSQREDKPYAKESITLLNVAEDTKLSPRLLSEFLNKYYNVNFCTWINTLRIEEVKRLLVESPNLSLAEISDMVGFSDPASLSKIFKKIVEESPSTYKKRMSV